MQRRPEHRPEEPPGDDPAANPDYTAVEQPDGDQRAGWRPILANRVQNAEGCAGERMDCPSSQQHQARPQGRRVRDGRLADPDQQISNRKSRERVQDRQRRKHAQRRHRTGQCAFAGREQGFTGSIGRVSNQTVSVLHGEAALPRSVGASLLCSSSLVANKLWQRPGIRALLQVLVGILAGPPLFLGAFE